MRRPMEPPPGRRAIPALPSPVENEVEVAAVAVASLDGGIPGATWLPNVRVLGGPNHAVVRPLVALAAPDGLPSVASAQFGPRSCSCQNSPEMFGQSSGLCSLKSVAAASTRSAGTSESMSTTMCGIRVVLPGATDPTRELRVDVPLGPRSGLLRRLLGLLMRVPLLRVAIGLVAGLAAAYRGATAGERSGLRFWGIVGAVFAFWELGAATASGGPTKRKRGRLYRRRSGI